MRYKVDFSRIFIFSVLIILFSRIWALLGSRPEAFAYGSIIYQLVDVILFVLCNLSIGIAAAIIFYYVQRYTEKKKDFELYTELRRIVLFLLYKHLEILSKIEEFEVINQRKEKRLLGFDIYDIPMLVSSYKKINSKELKEKFKNNLACLFKKMSEQQLQKFNNSFQHELDELKSKENIRYFKGSNELIDTVFLIYKDEFALGTDIYTKNRSEIQDGEEVLASDYMQFLDSTIELYTELTRFIESIEKRQVKVFVEMLD